MKLSINKALVFIKVVRERLNELKSLRTDVSKKIFWMNDKEKVEEPQYDVKLVDKKITELEKFILNADMAIKESNAKTEIEINADTDKLLSPIE